MTLWPFGTHAQTDTHLHIISTDAVRQVKRMQSEDFYRCLVPSEERGMEDEGRSVTGEEEMGLDDCDTGLCDPLNVENGVRQASLSLFILCLLFSSRLPKRILSRSQSCLNPRGSPAHATHKHILLPHARTHKQNTPAVRSHWAITGSQNSAPSLWLQSTCCCLIYWTCSGCLRSICVSVVSSCREPTVSSALRDHASASLTTSWIPAPDVWPIHRPRKDVMFALRNLLGLHVFRLKAVIWPYTVNRSYRLRFSSGVSLFLGGKHRAMEERAAL